MSTTSVIRDMLSSISNATVENSLAPLTQTLDLKPHCLSSPRLSINYSTGRLVEPLTSAFRLVILLHGVKKEGKEI